MAGLIATTIALIMAVSVLSSIPVRADGERKVILRVKPVYPEAAKKLKVAGTVLLNATVEPSGRVKAANPVMGENLLLKPAQQAVIQWRYTPSHYETIESVEVVFP
jgi:outer membrane biosynthesis protein TonB